MLDEFVVPACSMPPGGDAGAADQSTVTCTWLK